MWLCLRFGFIKFCLQNACKVMALRFYQILPKNVALSNFAWKCVQRYLFIALWFYQILPKKVALFNFSWKCVQGLMGLWIYQILKKNLCNAFKCVQRLMVLSSFALKCGFIEFCLKMCASLNGLSHFCLKCVKGHSLMALSNLHKNVCKPYDFVKFCLKIWLYQILHENVWFYQILLESV